MALGRGEGKGCELRRTDRRHIVEVGSMLIQAGMIAPVEAEKSS